MKLCKQLLSLVLIVALFALFNTAVYTLVTARCGGYFEGDANADALEIERYLPFEETSEIVRLDASLQLTGELPVLDGAAALFPVYSAFANAVYPEESCHYDGEDFSAKSAVQFRNTLKAYTAVADGDADIVFCAAPSQAQLEYARQQGVELVLEPIGREAFVFLVNEQNPVSSLTVEQLRGIYTGEYRNWKELGGADRLINPLERIEGSGSQSALIAFLGEEPAAKSPFAFLGASIGFSFRYYADGMIGNSGIKLLSVNGVYPDADNIRSGAYPIVTEFYAVYRADNDNANVQRLINWILSDEGQQIIAGSGYVGIH